MADKKISELTDGGSTLTDNDVIPIVQGGNTKKASIGDIFDYKVAISNSTSSAVEDNLACFSDSTGRFVKDSGILKTDALDAVNKKHIQNSDTNLGVVATKSSPIDADLAIYRDSESEDILVTSTWAQIKAYLKSYFDTLYFNTRPIELVIVDFTTDVTIGDGKGYFIVPDELNGLSLTRVAATAITAGSDSGSPAVNTTIQIYSATQYVNMLSTEMAIEPGETSTRTSSQPGTIDANHAVVITGDILRIDITAVSGTAPKGLIVEMVFSKE